VSVKQGDDLNITCSTLSPNDKVSDVLRVFKEAPGIHPLPSAITDNSFVKVPYRKLNRLKVSYDGQLIQTILSFTGIRGEDAGMYGCFCFSSDKNIARVSVHVDVPIESVHLFATASGQTDRRLDRSSGEEEEEGEVQLVEGSGIGVTCVATLNGSLTAPQISVDIDGKDVTRLFVHTTESEVRDQENTDDVGTHIGVARLTYNASRPDPAFNMKTLSCRATQKGFKEKVAETYLIVKYKPVITCARTEMSARVGEGVTLSCDVSANPSSRLTWLRGNSSTQISIDTNNTHIDEKTVKFDQTRVTLHIVKMREEDFTEYTLTAVNDVGEHNVTFLVHRAKSGTLEGLAYSQADSTANAGVRSAEMYIGCWARPVLILTLVACIPLSLPISL